MSLKGLFKRQRLKRLRRVFPTIAIIFIAGLMIVLISLTQYNYARRLVEEELSLRAEDELTIKSIRVRALLKSHERMVNNYLWPIQRQSHDPEGFQNILNRIVVTNHDVMGAFVAFVPDAYPGLGRLYEPVTFRRGDSIISKQMGGPMHDYTRREFYHKAIEEGKSSWTDPYLDVNASGKEVVTYSTPLADEKDKVIGTFGIDLSTKGIVDTLNFKHKQESTFFLLLTENGRLISQPDTSHVKWHDVNQVVQMINDSTCSRKLSSSGDSRIITFKASEDKSVGYVFYAFMKGQPHWQVVMVCYDDEVFGKLKNMSRNFILLMLGAFSLLGFIIYRFNQYVKRLHESKISKERTDSELNIAKTIQSEMLPSGDINRPDVDVSGTQVTALEVGGDLYDYFIRDEKLYFCIGDVSGKGVPSSLVMAVVHSHFRSYAQHETNPARIMAAINESATEGNKTNMFVTLFIGVLDLPSGRLRYCNAGHDAALIINGGVKTLQVNSNLPVGVFNDFKFVMQETQLPQNVTLLLYTDGLTEMADPMRRLFGLQRIIDTTQTCLEQGKTSPAMLMSSLHDEAKRFANGAQQSDDLTMLTVHYHRPDEKLVLNETITLGNDVTQVPELNSFVKSVTDRLNLDPSQASQLMLAVEEAVVNVMNYAYPIGTNGDVTIQASATGQWLKFIITDQGKAFDPTIGGHADTTLSAEDRPIGGLGILLVRSLMDSINYERFDGKNMLTLTKNYGTQQVPGTDK